MLRSLFDSLSLNSEVFHLLEDKWRFSAPLRIPFLIRVLDNNGRRDNRCHQKKKPGLHLTIISRHLLESHLTG